MTRPTVRPGRTLPPLNRARTRIALLASSYLDASTASVDGGIGGRPESRQLAHNPDLWPHGSYDDLERAWLALPAYVDRGWFQSFWRVYVAHGSRLVRDQRGKAIIGYEGDPQTKRRPRTDSRGRPLLDENGHRRMEVTTCRPFREFPVDCVAKANLILDLLEARMRFSSSCFVPAQVSEAAGYLPGEAKAYDRKPDKEAA